MVLIFFTTGFSALPGVTVGIGVAVGETGGTTGVLLGVGEGVGVGEVVGVTACFTFAQRFTFPDLTQIKFVGFDFAIRPTLEHLSPTFTAALLGCICPRRSATSKNTRTGIPIE